MITKEQAIKMMEALQIGYECAKQVGDEYPIEASIDDLTTIMDAREILALYMSASADAVAYRVRRADGGSQLFIEKENAMHQAESQMYRFPVEALFVMPPEYNVAMLINTLTHVSQWISVTPHGDNCFLHNDGGEFDTCFCGKDALQDLIDSVISTNSGQQEVM